jgi:ribosomal protein L11 methyltransferase
VIRLAIRVQRAHAELVLAELLELAPAGVEETEIGEQTVEYAVYGAAGELPSLPDLKAAAGDGLVEISTSETADDWQDRWRQFHRPVLVAPSDRWAGVRRQVPALRVRPPWEPASAGGGEPCEEIVIDPGQAFGTGGHATTRLCLEMLLELAATEPEHGALLDVGTGSGVLAIAAARLGFSPVLALDHDRLSVDAARANAAVNGASLELRRADLRNQAIPWLGRADAPLGPIVLLANLLRPLLLDLAHTIAAPPAHLLASGLLCDQVNEVVAVFAQRFGLRERRRLEDREWAAVWLVAG